MPRDFLADENAQPVTENYAPRDFLAEQPRENIGTAAFLSPFRIIGDVLRGAGNFGRQIPQYYQAAKTEVPGAINTFINDRPRANAQLAAGTAELGQRIFNTPHDIVNYLSQRLHLVPDQISKMVQMGRMPSDTEGMINQTFGNPSSEGDALLRGMTRNALNIAGAGEILPYANPLRYTAKGIAGNVLREESRQVASHTKRYNNIWNEAEKTGFNQVPVDMNLLKNNLQLIEKYKTPREFSALKEFTDNPTLQNAQKAQSDMGVIARALEDKSRTSSLLSEERALYDAAKGSEKHIEENMFRNMKGQTNQALQKKYRELTNSYRENVVPYKYNPHIQAYRNREMTAPELVNALSRGEFAAKKGSRHPAIRINKMIPGISTMAPIGLLGYLLGTSSHSGNYGNGRNQ